MSARRSFREWRGDVAYRPGFAGWGFAIAFRVLCPDGVSRVTHSVSEPDTMFSRPASVRVGRLVVRGFVTGREAGYEFVPFVLSPRPATWPWVAEDVRRAWDAVREQARDALARARAARWHDVPGGDASPKNQARCARLYRAACRDAQERRRRAWVYRRAYVAAMAHEVARGALT